LSEPKTANPARQEPSEIAGRYVVETKLGAGAFGTVYKAKDKILGRMVAIKTIRLEGLAASGASLEELLKRFMREAQVSAQLKHPNIVTIYDVGEASGLSYLAMEFIDGVGLEKVIREVGALPIERAASIAAQVASALDYAHGQKVVHRDIKPANVMLEAGDRVKVADFGIARVTNSTDQLTATGGLLGTPSYMSPEQAKGNELDGRSDLFSVGCVLYEMLTGKRAFRGESITGLIFKVITEDPEPLKDLRKDVPDAMVRIVAKAMAKTQEARFQSGRELAAALQPFVGVADTPTMRQAETPTESLPVLDEVAATAQMQPTIAAAPTRVTPKPAVPAVSPPAPPARPAPPPLARPAQRGRSGSTGLFIGLAVLGVLAVGVVLVGAWMMFSKPKQSPAVASSAPPTVTAPAVTTTTLLATAPTPAPATPEPVATSSAPQTRRETATPPPPQTRRADAGTPAPELPARPAATSEPPSTPAYAHLDEQPSVDGTEAGRRVADRFRGGSSSGGFGASGPMRARARVPPDLTPAERPAVATLMHLIGAEEAYHRANGRYAPLPQLVQARMAQLDVPLTGNGFQRRNYRFQLVVEDDGFRVVAMPGGPAGRPFVGDDSGIVRVGTR
jgi:serine/threonine-protein kinase